MLKIVFAASDDSGGATTTYPLATKAEAEAGVSNISLMTPLRTKEAIDYSISSGGIDAAIDTALLSTMIGVTFNLQSEVAATTVPLGYDYIYCLGYAKRGDHPMTRFKRADTSTPVNNLAWVRDAAGVYFINDEARIDVRTMGAFPTGQRRQGASIIAASTRLTLAGAGFTTADVGKWIQINGAGTLFEDSPGNKVWMDYHTTTIAAFVDSENVDIALAAVQTVAPAENQWVFWATDNTTGLKNACRAAATLNRFMYVPGNFYYYLSLLSICGVNGYDNIRVEGDGPSSVIVHGTGRTAGNGSMFYIVGGMITRGNLAAPAAAGTDVLAVPDSSLLAIDSYLAIRDKSQPFYELSSEEPFGPLSGYHGEIVRVREVVDATHIKLHAMLEESYNASVVAGQETDIRTIVPITDVTIRNISLDLSKPMNAGFTSYIGAGRTLRFTVENVWFQHGPLCFWGSYCIDWSVRNCHMEWVGPVDGNEPDGDHDVHKGYAITANTGNHNGLVQGCHCRNVRHFITGAATGDIPPKHVELSGCIVSEAMVGFDNHPGADYWTFSNCHTTGALWSDDINEFGWGFQIRGNHNEVIGCTANGCGVGFYTCLNEGTRFLDCTARSCELGFGINCCRDIEIYNGKVIDPRVMGLNYFFNNVNLAQPLQLAGNFIVDGFVVYGNPTQTSEVDEWHCHTPCGMQFGTWTMPSHVFVAQWREGITIRNWRLDDCITPFVGHDPEAIYGPGIISGATGQNMHREEVLTAGIAMLTSGILFLSEIDLQIGRRIASVGTMFAAAPVAQTNLWFGLFDKNLNCLSKTANALAVAPSTTALTLTALDKTIVTRYEGRYYIGICQTAGTTSTVYGRTIAAAFAGLSPALAGNSIAALTTPASYPAIASATSASSIDLTFYFPAKKIVTQAGKAFIPGMRVKVVRTSDAAVYMLGTVTSYSTIVLFVEVDTIVGTGTFTDWTITADAVATAITATGNIAFGVVA